jgi:G3E family GTPase
VLTKTDLATAETADRLTRRLRQINPDAPLWQGAEDDLDAKTLLSNDGDGVKRCEWADCHGDTPDQHHPHAEDIATLALSLDEPVDWTRFGIWLTMLLHRHGDKLLRVKGILNVANAAAPVAVHTVQHLVHPPRHLGAWTDGDRLSRLVFIARGLDPALVERSFRAFSAHR